MLVLILISAVACEWVEISQQHYRTPIRTLANKPTDEYTNHSLEYNWNQAIKPNIGHIKRVQVERNNDKEQTRASNIQMPQNPGPLNNEEIPRKQNIDRVTNLRTSTNAQQNNNRKSAFPSDHSSMNIKNESADDKVKGTVQKVSNVGSVRRVQLANTPVKSPTLKLKPEEIEVTPGLGDRRENSKPETKISNGPTTNKTDKGLMRNYNSNPRNKLSGGFDNVTRMNIDRPEFITEDEPLGLNKNIREFTTETILLTSTKSPESFAQMHNTHADRTVFEMKRDHGKDGCVKKITDSNKAMNSGKNNEASDEKIQQSDDESLKESTMENVLKFMKVVAETISKNTRQSFGSKIRYLMELKQSILANIENRIESTWPDDSVAPEPGPRRRSRTVHEASLGESRGHVEFPSSESALMTISFLTFAVFLIKLVLQVIQTYKNKTMLVAPLVVATARRFRERKRN